MKPKLSFSLDRLTSDIYQWISEEDKAVLDSSLYDFDLGYKISHWKDVMYGPRIQKKGDREAFYTGKFSK